MTLQALGLALQFFGDLKHPVLIYRSTDRPRPAARLLGVGALHFGQTPQFSLSEHAPVPNPMWHASYTPRASHGASVGSIGQRVTLVHIGAERGWPAPVFGDGAGRGGCEGWLGEPGFPPQGARDNGNRGARRRLGVLAT